MKLSVAILGTAHAGFGRHVVEMTREISDKYETRLINEFKQWKDAFDKEYETIVEEVERMGTWMKNMLHIEEHNFQHSLGEHTFTLAMNKYGDVNSTEFASIYNGFLHKKGQTERKGFGLRKDEFYFDFENDDTELAKSMDWRELGAVTEVKDQGQCGSCWSFSATGALEGQMFQTFGKLPDLSEQNLVDCSKPEGNQGCNGGLMDAAFQYVKDQDGLDGEDFYPYEGVDNEPCRYDRSHRVADDVGFKMIPEGNEKALKHALAKVGPVSVAIDASNPSFQFYQSGVYYEPKCSPENLDHGVLAVGYGVEDGDKYYLVKNSWSEAWGDKGYIKMARNKDNHCGIASYAVYPLASSADDDTEPL